MFTGRPLFMADDNLYYLINIFGHPKLNNNTL